MTAPREFPLVRGRALRMTRTTGCGVPVSGSESIVVTEGFVSVALTTQITEPEAIVVTNAAGDADVRDTGVPQFTGYSANITFTKVSPAVFTMLTGQQAVYDDDGKIIGFRMNSRVSMKDAGFALEMWSGVPGVACTGDEGAYGYLLLPFFRAGVIGDLTIENAAVTFTVTNAQTQDGNGWGAGLYKVIESALTPGTDVTLAADPVDENDHLLVMFTTVAPPGPTDGAITYPPAAKNSASPGDKFWGERTILGENPAGAALLAGLGFVADPTSAWTTGQSIKVGTFDFNWNGTAWEAGVA